MLAIEWGLDGWDGVGLVWSGMERWYGGVGYSGIMNWDGIGVCCGWVGCCFVWHGVGWVWSRGR